ncbi:hypothetical protein FG386_001387 [Cryptosporidium ryanae]|uniref:uncharacterized protein n=1 Tax=Cryptosporidium ryanae TaxID=515981 RepID=UPI00351A4424|nr:hypothetical protein FG386_001387 [Cryptosporidium ryanae]
MLLTGQTIITGLQSNTPEIVLETLNALLLTVYEGDELEQLIEYLKVSPSCVELFQIWSKYLTESTTLSKKSRKVVKRNGDIASVTELKRDRIEVIILVKTLNCLSKIMEFNWDNIPKAQVSSESIEKEIIDKLGMFILTKHMSNVYRLLNTTNRDILSSTLRLLTSISNLSEIHKGELMNIFNFNLQNFVSISRYFEQNKDKKLITSKDDCSVGNFEEITYELKELSTVRFQYLRFVLSFIIPSGRYKLGSGEILRYSEDTYGKNYFTSESKTYNSTLENLLAIKGIANSIFKSSSHYDDWRVTMYVLYIFEKFVIENGNIENNIKRSFFSMTIINYIFNNLNDMLENVTLDLQLRSICLEDLGFQSNVKYANNSSNMFVKYCIILSKLFCYHTNSKTREKTRLILNWLNSLKNIKYPILQEAIISVYNELSLNEKINYYDNFNFNYLVQNCCIKINENNANVFSCKNIDYILIFKYISKLLNFEYETNYLEKNDIFNYIANELFNNKYNNNIDKIQFLCDWVFPNKLMAGLKILSTKENIFVNISIIVIQINVLKRLEYITERISHIETEQSIDKYYILSKMRQNVYSRFPDINNIVSILRFYFNNNNSAYSENDPILYSIINFKLNNKTDFNDKNDQSTKINEKIQDSTKEDSDEDEIFVNIRSNVVKKQEEQEIKKVKESDSVNDKVSYSVLLYHSLLKTLNSSKVWCVHCDNSFNDFRCGKKKEGRDEILEYVIRIKFEILKLLLELIKCVLKNFGNEFLLSMGYKFDYTRIVLDEFYRECYMNTEFMDCIPVSEYKALFENQIYYIILYSLNFSEIHASYWNCNKYLLYKFLDSLIPILYKFRREKELMNESDATIGNKRVTNHNYFHNFLTGVWIKMVSSLFVSNINTKDKKIKNFNKIFYYFDSTRIAKYTDNSDSKIMYFHFKTILFILKTLFNYSILIRDYGISCVGELCNIKDENKHIYIEFVKGNLDTILLLLIIGSNNRGENTLMETMNIKNGLTSVRSDLEEISFYKDTEKYNLSKQSYFNIVFYDYISGIIENTVLVETKMIKENEKVIFDMLENAFKNWNKIEIKDHHCLQLDCDLSRRRIITIIKEEKEAEYIAFLVGIRELLGDIREYYNLLCETNNHMEYNTNFLINEFLLVVSSNKREKKKVSEIKNEILDKVFKLNYIQISHEKYPDYPSTACNHDSNIKMEYSRHRELVSANLRVYLSARDKMRKRMLESFVNVIIKFNLDIELILGNSGSENITSIKESLLGANLNKIENENVIYFLINNISNLELFFLLEKLIVEKDTKKTHGSLLISRLLEKVMKTYVEINKNDYKESKREKALFNVCFCNLIDTLIDKGVFNEYRIISLLPEYGKDSPLKSDSKDIQGELVLPLNIFDYNGDLVSFGKIVIELIPYLFFNSKEFYDSLVNLFTFWKFSVDKLPIGIQLLYIIDKNLNTIYEVSNHRDSLRDYISDGSKGEGEFIRMFSDKLIRNYKKYRKGNFDFYEKNELIESFESLNSQDMGLFWIVNKCYMEKYIKENVTKFSHNYIKKSKHSFLFESDVTTDDINVPSFWHILDILFYKQLNQCLENTNSYGIIVNSNFVFGFVVTLFNKFNSLNPDLKSKDDLYVLSETTYLVYLFYYDHEKAGTCIYPENCNGEDTEKQTVINTLVSSYSNLLELFQMFKLSDKIVSPDTEKRSNEKSYQNVVFYYCYYYILLTPIVMDRCLNPLYEPIMLELILTMDKNANKSRYKDSIKGYNTILNYRTNNSFYNLLEHIGTIEKYKSKYPIPFIETSKVLINDLKLILDYVNHNGIMCSSNAILVSVSSFVMYIAKNKQNKVKYSTKVYNTIPNFILLKINRINVFLNKIHESIFNFLNSEKFNLNDHQSAEKGMFLKRVLGITVTYIFVEYILSMEVDKDKAESAADNGKEIDFEYLRAEHITSYLRTTRIKDFKNRKCLYNKILDHSTENYHGVLSLIPFASMNEYNNYSSVMSVFDDEKVSYYFMKLVLCNHAVYRTNSKISQLFDFNGFQKSNECDSGEYCKGNTGLININVHKLTRYWYHFYSVYLNNFTESINTNGGIKTNFNWISPDTSRINNTMKHFPYNSRLISNSTTTFEGNLTYKCEHIGTPVLFESIYDIGYVIPVINSRLKLAYSILRERGFRNSKNKTSLGESIGDGREKDERTCSGFIKDYSKLSNSIFSRQIDDGFIWLRNFCKNGSLRLVINSLSCVDFSIRYYSYQIISMLFELVSFHFKKYMNKYTNFQESNKLDLGDDNLTENDESNNKKRRKNKLKTRVKLLRHIFKELPQIYTILNTLKNTVSGAMDNSNSKHINCIRLSSFVTNFCSDSIEILFKPEHKLFKKINYFLLSRPFIDRYDIPLLLSLLYSEDPDDHLKHNSFVFNQLENSVGVLRYLSCKCSGIDGNIEFGQEHDAVNRRFIISLLLNYVKTNNVYSQHNYFTNLIHILSIILNIISDQNCTFTNQYSNTYNSNYINNHLIGNNITHNSPNIPSIVIESKEHSEYTWAPVSYKHCSSYLLTQLLVNQYFILDFIINLIRQIKSVKKQIHKSSLDKSQYLNEIEILIMKVIIKLVKNVFQSNHNDVLSRNNKNKLTISHFKNSGNEINKTILRFIGGYGSIYALFSKFLTCIELLSEKEPVNACNNTCFDTSNCNNMNREDGKANANKALLFDMWFYSYLSLVYTVEYIINDSNMKLIHNDLIFKFQKIYSNL